jgi:hypothetical protein
VCRGGREGSIDALLVQGIRDLLRTGSPSLSRV